jgi:hypothetical protein
MKLYKQIIFILIVFFKTETLLSENSLFAVNNIEIEKKNKITNNALADKAIKKGFDQLITKILLKDDINKLSDLQFSSIKQLVTYYQITNTNQEEKSEELVNFSVTFDKNKMHSLFFKRGISYSEILDKELYILPILIKEDEIFTFSNNYFYENWNKVFEEDLLEFILPIENIEILQHINKNKNNLINLEVDDLFQEYPNKNLAIILIEKIKSNNKKVYIKAKIQKKNISKSLNFKRQDLKSEKFNQKIVIELKKELINLIKSANLIDIRTPSFLNVKLDLNKKSSLVILNSKIKNIESIENVYVQNFNKDSMNLRIKYLGKLEKIINQLKKENINLNLVNEEWVIKTL